MEIKYPIITAACACLLSALLPSAQADVHHDWNNTGVGDWNNAANWNNGIPVDTTDWDIGTIANGGTAVLSTVQAGFNELQVGNNGVAGNLIITNGGNLTVNDWLVVARNDASGNTPLSTLTITGTGVLNKGGSGFLIADTANCTAQMLVTGNGTVNVTGGWNSIGNSGAGGSVTLQGNAVYNVAGIDWNVGDYGAGRGTFYIKDNATLNVSRFWIGKGGTSIGALWQSGGTINGTGGANEWTIGGDGGGDANSYGFISLSGGTLTCPFNFQNGRYGKGIIYQTGGTNTQGSWCDNGRFPGSIGINWITGGLFQHISTGQRYFVAEQGRGETTVAGSGVLDTAVNIVFGGTATAVGNLNLNGGTLRVPGIDKWGGTTYLNFNGGTLRAKISNPLFLDNVLTEATVYSGNAIVDTAGNDVTVAQPLVAASGNGVLSVPVVNGGAGYMEPPVVQIDPSGVGSGAMAVAQIDPVAGTVTSIVVTCPGYGYLGVPSVTLLGGGASTPATLGTAVIGAVSSGGLIKNSNGKLTLTGANTYTGATVVNAGSVILTPNATGLGAVSVANGAGFGVTLPYANGQLFVPSVTMGTSSGSSLAFDLGAFGNPISAPLSVVGNLAMNGTVTVNVAAALPQLGQIPLLQYGSRSGSGGFVLGSLSSGVQATLVDDTVNKLVYLNVTSIGLPRWEGLAGGNWDVNVTTNWIELSTGLPTKYKDGFPVLFDDTALGTSTVNLVADVLPASVSLNDSTLNYTFSGNNKIGGTGGLTKQGSGTLTIANALNTYTGSTVIKGGVVAITNLANGGSPSALGAAASLATNLVIANATLSYSGPAVAVDRGYSVQDTNSTINTLSDLSLGGPVSATAGSSFVKTGPAKLTYSGSGVKELSGGAFPGYQVRAGTVLFNGTGGAQTNHNQNEFWVGNTIDTGASLILSNTTLNIDSWLAVGRGNGSAGYLSTATLYDSKLRTGSASLGYDNGLAGNLAQQTLTLNGISTFTNNGDMNLGESSGSTASIFLNDSSALYSAGRVHLGWHSGAIGNLTMANSSAMTVNAWYSIANEGGTAVLTLKDNSSLWVLQDMNVTDVNTGDGTMNIQNNALVTFGSYFVGKGAGSVGLVNQSGGTVLGRLTGNEVQIGFHGQGTWNLTGGTISASNHWFVIGRYTDGPGILNVSAGTIRQASTSGKLFRVGEEGTGVLNLSGTGDIRAYGDAVTVGSVATGNGTINLNGGSFLANRIIGGPGASVLNFNGGVLRVGPNPNADFLSGLNNAYVLAGGAVIDTAGNSVAINQSLLDGGGNGGLTKQDNGTLALNGANTYTGTTTVSAGTLGGNGSIAGPVVVAGGATFSPGTSIGALAINNTLNLAGTSTTLIELNKTALTNDSVVGVTTLTYGGTLVLKNLSGALAANDTFKIFNASTYNGSFSSVVSQTLGQTVTWDTSKLTVDGSVKVLTAVPAPVSITPTVSGGNLTLTWPSSQTGWQLQAQTNSLNVGLNSNWVVVPGSTATNQVTFPIDAAQGSVFFRLLLP